MSRQEAAYAGSGVQREGTRIDHADARARQVAFGPEPGNRYRSSAALWLVEALSREGASGARAPLAATGLFTAAFGRCHRVADPATAQSRLGAGAYCFGPAYWSQHGSSGVVSLGMQSLAPENATRVSPLREEPSGRTTALGSEISISLVKVFTGICLRGGG